MSRDRREVLRQRASDQGQRLKERIATYEAPPKQTGSEPAGSHVERMTLSLPADLNERISREARRLDYEVGSAERRHGITRSYLMVLLLEAGLDHLDEIETQLRARANA